MVLNLKLLISTSLLVVKGCVHNFILKMCAGPRLKMYLRLCLRCSPMDYRSTLLCLGKTGCEDKWFFGNKFGAFKMWFWTGSSEILKIMSLPVITMLYNGPKRHFISKDHLLIFLCISQIFPKGFWEMFLICTHTWQMDLKATVQASVYGTDENPGHVENKL